MILFWSEMEWTGVLYVKWFCFEVKWSGVNWRVICEVILFWNEMKRSELAWYMWSDFVLKWSKLKWSELAWYMWSDFVLKWSELRWSSYVQLITVDGRLDNASQKLATFLKTRLQIRKCFSSTQFLLFWNVFVSNFVYSSLPLMTTELR